MSFEKGDGEGAEQGSVTSAAVLQGSWTQQPPPCLNAGGVGAAASALQVYATRPHKPSDAKGLATPPKSVLIYLASTLC